MSTNVVRYGPRPPEARVDHEIDATKAPIATEAVTVTYLTDPDIVAEANQRMSKAVRANPITDIPREFLLIGRVVGLLSGLGAHLDSRVDMRQTIVPYTQAALEGAK